MRNMQPKRAIVRRRRGVAIALAGAAMVITLASCGGGRDDGNPPATPPPVATVPPASASASAQGFIDYLKTLIVTMQNTVEPFDVNSFIAPTSDTTEPDPGV